MDEDGSSNISANEFEGFSFLFNFEVRAVKQIFDEFDVSGKQVWTMSGFNPPWMKQSFFLTPAETGLPGVPSVHCGLHWQASWDWAEEAPAYAGARPDSKMVLHTMTQVNQARQHHFRHFIACLQYQIPLYYNRRTSYRANFKAGTTFRERTHYKEWPCFLL